MPKTGRKSATRRSKGRRISQNDGAKVRRSSRRRETSKLSYGSQPAAKSTLKMNILPRTVYGQASPEPRRDLGVGLIQQKLQQVQALSQQNVNIQQQYVTSPTAADKANLSRQYQGNEDKVRALQSQIQDLRVQGLAANQASTANATNLQRQIDTHRVEINDLRNQLTAAAADAQQEVGARDAEIADLTNQLRAAQQSRASPIDVGVIERERDQAVRERNAAVSSHQAQITDLQRATALETQRLKDLLENERQRRMELNWERYEQIVGPTYDISRRASETDSGPMLRQLRPRGSDPDLYADHDFDFSWLPPRESVSNGSTPSARTSISHGSYYSPLANQSPQLSSPRMQTPISPSASPSVRSSRTSLNSFGTDTGSSPSLAASARSSATRGSFDSGVFGPDDVPPPSASPSASVMPDVISPSSASPASPSQIDPLKLINHLQNTQAKQERRRSQISAADEVIAAALDAPEVPQRDLQDLISANEELVQEAATTALHTMATEEALVGATAGRSVAQAMSQNPDITPQEVVEVIANAAAVLEGVVSPDVVAAVGESAPAIATQVTAAMAARRMQANFRRKRDERLRVQSEASADEDKRQMAADEEAAAAAAAAQAAQQVAEDANAGAAELLRQRLAKAIGWNPSMGQKRSDPSLGYSCNKDFSTKRDCEMRAMCRWDDGKSKCYVDSTPAARKWKTTFGKEPLKSVYDGLEEPRPLLSDIPWRFSAPTSPASSTASSASRSSPVSPAGPRTRSRGKVNAASQGKRAASPAGPRRSGRNK